jgi:hypothetical protein
VVVDDPDPLESTVPQEYGAGVRCPES